MHALLQFIRRNPWIYVVLAFVVLGAAWATLIVLAVGQKTPDIPLQNRSQQPIPQPANP